MEAITELLEDFGRNSYVEGLVLMSRVGVPIASCSRNKISVPMFASLASVAIGSASEMANNSGSSFREVNIVMDTGRRIIIRPLTKLYVMVIQSRIYDDKIRDEISKLESSLVPLL